MAINSRRHVIAAHVVEILAVVACIAEPVALAGPPEQDSGKRPVTVTQMLEVAGATGSLYKISYDYDFPGRTAIYIKGVGSVSPKGRLTYWSVDRQLEFLDHVNGARLELVPLDNPTRMMGNPSARFPAEADFPEMVREVRASTNAPAGDLATAVLDHYFPLGYRPYEQGKVNHYLTTYRTIPLPSKRRFAEVAVLLTHEPRPASRETLFVLKYKARESRSHTDWYDEISPETEQAVAAFLSQMVDSLKTGGTQ